LSQGWNSYYHIETSVTLDELEKSLKINKNGKWPRKDNINSELYRYSPEDFKLRLVQFLNNINKESIPNL
jgi:hypothetical protein